MINVKMHRDPNYNRAGEGIGIGTIIAMYISWTMWHSILWVIVHGLLGWLYVIYFGVKYGFKTIE